MASERYIDLMKQGFMKPRREPRKPAPKKPTVGCELCENWHEEGRHTRPIFKVVVEVHKYVDLSDRPVERKFPVGASDEDDAVYKMRETLDKERKKYAAEHGLVNEEGVAILVDKNGQKRYLGRVLLGHTTRA